MTGVTAAGVTPASRPPLWLVLATAAMALVLLVMSITETSFKGQYLIDEGEYLSLGGLAFILVAGLYLHRRGQLTASLPLVLPWLLYPVITQGDQLIDNLSITWMRIIVHVLLAAIFGTPVLVIALAARWRLGLAPRSVTYLSVALLTAEIGLAYVFLGTLMILTLVVMIALVLYFGTRPRPERRPSSLAALAVLVAGVLLSGGLYLGFKNRPGAYQGSPSFYMDPSQPESRYDLARVAVPAGAVSPAAGLDLAGKTLALYAASLQRLLEGYYVLDRNYNYHFHNELFLQSTPLLPDYRIAGLRLIAEGDALRSGADTMAAQSTLAPDTPIGALLADVRGYVAFSFDRAATLERLSAGFETTKAGLQHATHIYEGEGKYLGVQLADLLEKHRAVLADAELAPIVHDFVAKSRAIHDKYANRIVGF